MASCMERIHDDRCSTMKAAAAGQRPLKLGLRVCTASTSGLYGLRCDGLVWFEATVERSEACFAFKLDGLISRHGIDSD